MLLTINKNFLVLTDNFKEFFIFAEFNLKAK